MEAKNPQETLENYECFQCRVTRALVFSGLGVYILYEGRKKYGSYTHKSFIRSDHFRNLSVLLKKFGFGIVGISLFAVGYWNLIN